MGRKEKEDVAATDTGTEEEVNTQELPSWLRKLRPVRMHVNCAVNVVVSTPRFLGKHCTAVLVPIVGNAVFHRENNGMSKRHVMPDDNSRIRKEVKRTGSK